MFHEDSFSLDSFSTDSWMFLLEVPYFDLSGKQRIYVRSVLESVYTSTEADQIVAVAAQNSLSVMDAAVAVRVNVEPLQTIVAAAMQRKAPEPVAERRIKQPKAQERTNKPAYAVASTQSVFSRSDGEAVFVPSSDHQLVAMTDSKPLFINTRSKE